MLGFLAGAAAGWLALLAVLLAVPWTGPPEKAGAPGRRAPVRGSRTARGGQPAGRTLKRTAIPLPCSTWPPGAGCASISRRRPAHVRHPA